MTPKLMQIVEALPEVRKYEDVQRLVEHVRDTYDLDHAIYYALSLGGDRAGEEFGAMTYAPQWHQRYVEADFKLVDPVVSTMLGGYLPVDWATFDLSSRPIKRFWNEAMAHGVGNQGYSVPLHGPQGQFAMFAVNKACSDETWAKLIGEIAQDMLLVANHIHRHVLEFCEVSNENLQLNLSPRERDVLTMVAGGQKRAQIAHHLKISENTLRVYVESARHKLGASNTFHAVAIAVKKGYVAV